MPLKVKLIKKQEKINIVDVDEIEGEFIMIHNLSKNSAPLLFIKSIFSWSQVGPMDKGELTALHNELTELLDMLK